jgi:hypothetical protein
MKAQDMIINITTKLENEITQLKNQVSSYFFIFYLVYFSFQRLI